MSGVQEAGIVPVGGRLCGSTIRGIDEGQPVIQCEVCVLNQLVEYISKSLALSHKRMSRFFLTRSEIIHPIVALDTIDVRELA